MEREKASQDLGRKARRIRKKKQQIPVFSVIVEEPNGNIKELHDQASMVNVLAESNKRRQQQCQGTAFMTAPLIDIFEYIPPEEQSLQVIN